MTERVVCLPAVRPLEDFVAGIDPLFGKLAQRRGFRVHPETSSKEGEFT